MYYSIEKHYKCSRCGAIDSNEEIINIHEHKRRCQKCGHEVIISTTSVYPDTGTSDTYFLNADLLEKYEKF